MPPTKEATVERQRLTAEASGPSVWWPGQAH
jgi:hypothetical protein